MFTWLEGEGGKGCNEIGSTLLAFEDLLEHNKDKLIAWSDGCYGQNKNNAIVGVWMYFIKSGKFKQIEHKFPVVGHTRLDSDRDFGKIEIRLKKEGDIYTSDQYKKIIQTAQKKNEFIVNNIGKAIYDCKKIMSLLGLLNRKLTTTGDKFLISKLMWLKIVEFGVMQFKLSHNDEEEWQTIDYHPKNTRGGQLPNFDIDVLPKVGLRKIKKKKMDDIKKFYNYIPRTYRAFYDNLQYDDVESEGISESDHDLDSESE